MTSAIIAGALAMGYAVAGTFFLRFWRDTSDRLFALFALAFALLAVQRLLLAMFQEHPFAPNLYLVRLAAFVIILLAIIDKNRARRR